VPLLENLATFGRIAAGPIAILVILLSEAVYHIIIKTCCGDINDYQSYHDALRKRLCEARAHTLETTKDIFAILDTLAFPCFQNAAGLDNRQESVAASDAAMLESQESIPPPYWVCLIT
jgi:hypothetical protein